MADQAKQDIEEALEIWIDQHDRSIRTATDRRDRARVELTSAIADLDEVTRKRANIAAHLASLREEVPDGQLDDATLRAHLAQ